VIRSCAWLESLHIGDCILQQGGIVEELGKPAIAVEAQYAPHSTGRVVVIDVLGVPGPTHRADAVLLKNQPLDGNGVEVVATAKMELPSSAVVLLVIGSRDRVVARLAIVTVTR
jgi:hypothetical protein